MAESAIAVLWFVQVSFGWKWITVDFDGGGNRTPLEALAREHAAAVRAEATERQAVRLVRETLNLNRSHPNVANIHVVGRSYDYEIIE